MINSVEEIILSIKKMVHKEHYEVKTISANTYDIYLKRKIPQSYISCLVFIDKNMQEHETAFIKENDTIPVHINSSKLPLCGCEVSATGRTIKTSLNKLHKLCKKMTAHKYGLYYNR